MKRLWILGLILITGCSSFRTTAIDRCPNDTLVVNPNRPMKGIPVSLRVPTHLEISVIETTYWEKQNVLGNRPTLTPLRSCRPTRTVTHRVCTTEKIFLVDPARPVAGTQSYGFSFTSNNQANQDDSGKGYLDEVSYKIDDQTIQESAKLLSNSLNFLNAFQVSAVNQHHPNTGSLLSTDRTVAHSRLDINSPSFEHDVEEFLDIHVNQVADPNRVCPQVCDGAFCAP